MKKLLTLLLVFALTLGLGAPALAFTNDNTAKDKVPYDLSIYLVEYDDNDLFGLASLPQSDRGYAKNEIVAAVVELYVPKDETIQPPDNLFLKISGENVELDITENYENGILSLKKSFEADPPDADVSEPIWDTAFPLPGMGDHEAFYMTIGRLAGETTCRWLLFAKVTGDDASLTAKLIDGEYPDYELTNNSALGLTLDGVQYIIGTADNVDADKHSIYSIFVGSGSDYTGSIILIETDKDHKSIGMTILPDGSEWGILGVGTNGKLGVMRYSNPAVLLTSGDYYEDIMDIYNDVVVDVFGLDYMLIGNYVRNSFFNAMVSPRTLIATVDIAPFTAYVTVPDNIVVDPPKTGDAASILGFIMVALSGAGGASALLLKKRG